MPDETTTHTDAVPDNFSNTAAIRDRFYEGERSLYGLGDTLLERVRFYPGESPLKHSHDIRARSCEFMGKYPLWHADRIDIEDCLFTVYARAGIWYSQNVHMRNVRVEAPKTFRQARHLTIERSRFPNAAETFWTCSDVTLKDVELKGADYVFMNGSGIQLDDVALQGNYSFQDAKDVVVRNSRLDSKDAFWGSENVTVYDSVLEGEYLGWHSKKLKLVNCTIRGEQPLCYATDLELIDCRMEETPLSFEHSTVRATVDGHILSIRNPKGGAIRARSVGAIILDQNCLGPGACSITVDAPQAKAG